MKITSDQQWTTPSWVLGTAANDLEKVSKDELFTIDMQQFMEPVYKQENGKNVVVECKACLAGAVMANTLKVDIPQEPSENWDDLILTIQDPIIDNALVALDGFRQGRLDSFFYNITESYLDVALGEDKGFPDRIAQVFSGTLDSEDIKYLVEHCRRWADKFKAEGY